MEEAVRLGFKQAKPGDCYCPRCAPALICLTTMSTGEGCLRKSSVI